MSLIANHFASILFGLFGFSFFISKSAFTAFYTLAVVFGLFKYPWNKLKQSSVYEKWMIALYPTAIFFGFFSSGGSQVALDILARWTWPLALFPVFYVAQNKNVQKMLFKSLAASLLVACLYSYYRFYNEFDFVYSQQLRVSAFWDILRWSYFCAVALSVIFAYVVGDYSKTKKEKNLLIVLFVLTAISLVLTNSRGAWIGALLGLFVAIIVQKKSIKYYLGYFGIICVLLLSSEGVRNRIMSSFSIQKEGVKITSTNKSNAARLHMWKVALDLYQEVPFFGVGFNNTKPALEVFLEKQGESYVSKYTGGDYSYNDQHSSYIAMLLQFGGVFTVMLYALFFIVTWSHRKNAILMSAMACTFFVYLFYGCIVSFEAIVAFSLVSWMILNLRPNFKS
jgi:O-antigen ligase